jgi:pimeloyl-ACP methyl ester carboxylesterase
MLRLALAVGCLTLTMACARPATPAPLTPTLEPRRCWLTPAGLEEGKQVTCFTLTVPVDPSTPGSNGIRLPVLRIRDEAPAHEDPIIHLIGGPGGTAASYASVLAQGPGLGLARATKRDVYYLDQRGTGFSDPTLTCGIAGGALCLDVRGHLENLGRAGFPPEQFNTVTNAADVEALRVAIGAEQVNLWGQSYGTTLALVAAARAPGTIRTLVLEAVSYPPVDAFWTNGPRAFADAFGRAVADCQADATCAASNPALAEAVEHLLARPPEERDALLVDLQSLLQFASGGPSSVPTFVSEARAKGPVAAKAAVKAELDTNSARLTDLFASGFSVTANLVVGCQESALFQRDETTNERANSGVDPRIRAALGTTAMAETTRCAAVPQGSQRAEDFAIGGITAPALLLSGRFDTNTPTEVAEQVRAQLKNARLVEVPRFGHLMMVLGSTCAQDAMTGFINDPRATVSACP